MDLQTLARLAGINSQPGAKSSILKESAVEHSDATKQMAAVAGVHLVERMMTEPTTHELWSFVKEFVAAVGDAQAAMIGISPKLINDIGEMDVDANIDSYRSELSNAVEAIVDYGQDHDVDWTPPWVPKRPSKDDLEAERADHYRDSSLS